MKTMLVLQHLGFAEQNYDVLKEVNNVIEDTIDDISVSIFDLSNKMMQINCAVFSIAELSSFSDGVMICFDTKHIGDLTHSYNNSKKVLYLWDLDWFFRPSGYEDLYDNINSEELTIIVRSEEHARVLENCFDRKPHAILEEFKLGDLWNLLA